MSKSDSKMSLSHILFLVGGFLLILAFLINGGIPSPSGNVVNFLVGIFKLIIIVGFYCFFLFQAKGCSSSVKSLAPWILLIIILGSPSLFFINDKVNEYLVPFGNSIVFSLIIVTGFIYLFIPNRILAYVFSISTFIYACLVTVSFILTCISSSSFSVSGLIIFLLTAISYVLVGCGAFKQA